MRRGAAGAAVGCGPQWFRGVVLGLLVGACCVADRESTCPEPVRALAFRKDGVSADEQRRDLKACIEAATNSGEAYPMLLNGIRVVVVDSNALAASMRDRGYRAIPVEEARDWELYQPPQAKDFRLSR
jgi:hypothetical protein